MKKLLLHILVAACLFFVVDRLLGVCLNYLYSRSNATDEYKISYANSSTTDPVLFFGSSRTLHHYVPSIFEQQLGVGCYNAADWGIKNIYYHYGLLGNILTRYTPRTIIFELHPCDWLDTPYSGVERAASLAPYCGMSPACDDMLRRAGKYWPCRLSLVYRFSGSLPNLLAGKWGTMDRRLKGWKPMEGEMDTCGVVAEEYPFPVDEERLALLSRFITTCKQRNVKLVFVVSPMYVCSKEDVFQVPRELLLRRNIPFLDHYRDTTFVGHAEYFYDFGHLNRKGAELFSTILSREIARI